MGNVLGYCCEQSQMYALLIYIVGSTEEIAQLKRIVGE